MSTSNSRRPRRQFTDEFEAEAVAMVDASGGEVTGQIVFEVGTQRGTFYLLHEEARGRPRRVGGRPVAERTVSYTIFDEEE